MAATSDNDVSNAATAGHDDIDGDTTAAAVAKRIPKLGDDDDYDRTVVQPELAPDGPTKEVPKKEPPEPVNEVPDFLKMSRARSVGRTTQIGVAPPPPAVKSMTAEPTKTAPKKPAAGLAGRAGVPVPAAGAKLGAGPSLASSVPKEPPPPKPTPRPASTPPDDEGVTKVAPALRMEAAHPLSLVPPGEVKITELPHRPDSTDETEVRTMIAPPAGAPAGKAAPIPAAGAPPPKEGAARTSSSDLPSLASGDSDDSDAVTALGRVPEGYDEAYDIKTSPPVLAPRPMLGGGRGPSGAKTEGQRLPVLNDDDESITTRGPPVDYEDDSVTTLGPVADPLRDGEERAAGGKPTAGARAHLGPPPDSAARDAPTLTAAAPAGGHLADMLRWMTGTSAAEPEELAENQTAVMANAPVRPPEPRSSERALADQRGRSAAKVAPRERPSDSALRIGRPDTSSGEKATLDFLIGGPVGGSSDMVPSFAPSSHRGPSPYATTEHAFHAPLSGARPEDNSDYPTMRRPPYGLLVGFVAVLSFMIPLMLFFLLHGGSGEPVGREKAELQPDRVVRADSLRSKAAAKPSASVAPNAPPRPRDFPRRR